MSRSLLYALSLYLLGAASAFAALPESYYSPHSRLATGRWMKVETDTAGVYQITPEQISAWGLGKAVDVCVYGMSAVDASTNCFGVFPDDLVRVPSVVTADGRVLFFGEGAVRGTVLSGESAEFRRNYYDNKSVYFITSGAGESSVATLPFSASDNVCDYHYSLGLIEREVQNPGMGGVVYHGPELKDGDKENFTFDLGGIDKSRRIFLHYDGAVNSARSVRFVTTFSDNIRVQRLNPISSTANTLATRLYTDVGGNAFLFLEGESSQMSVDIAPPVNFDGAYAAVDRVYVIYSRSNRLGASGELILNFPEANFQKANFRISGSDGDVMAWDVTDPLNIKNMELSGNAGYFEGTPASKDSRIVVFAPDAVHRSVLAAEEVRNTDLHALAVPDMLVVTTASLMDAAEEFADIHRTVQGLDVAVVCQDDIFNEYSSGVRTPAAVRRFIKMLYDKTPSKLRFLTLYGASTYDNRFLVTPWRDALICYECEAPEQARDNSTNYVSDQYFGILSDDFTDTAIASAPMNITVGRIPAQDAGLAREANEKSRRWLLHTPSAAAYLRALKFSDDGDYRLHFDHTEEFVSCMLAKNSAVTVSRADNLLYPWKDGVGEEAARKIRRSLVRGQGIFHYAGHGTSSDVTGEKIFSSSTVKSLVYDYAPLALFASCDIFPLDREPGSMAENMIFTVGGGAVGVITPSRKVYIDPNRIVSNAIGEIYASAQPGTTGADLLRYARNVLSERGMAGSLGYNTLCYNYCGDPALPLDVPEYTIDATFDGKAAADIVADLQPLRKIKVEGTVRRSDGELVRSFNGPVLIEVYDTPDSLATFVRVKDDGKSIKVLSDDNLLAEYGAVARDGVFSTEIVLPEPASGQGSKRIVVTASDAAARRCAAAPLIRAVIAEDGGDAQFTDDIPVIEEFYIDPADYISSEAVGTDFTAHAVICQPASGIATGSSGIRRALKVTVDGTETKPDLRGALRFADDGKAMLDIPLTNMSQGRHEIRIEAFSNAGQSFSSLLSVLVGTEGVAGTLEVIRDESAGEVEFRLDSECASGTLIVTDRLGRTVLYRRGCTFPCSWNLRNAEGQRVYSGPYKAWVLLDNDDSRGSTPKTEFVVL